MLKSWVHRWRTTIAWCVLALALTVIFVRQNENFADHKRIDHREIQQLCGETQTRWDAIRAVDIESTTPLADPADFKEDPSLARYITVRNGGLAARRQNLLTVLGERPVCKDD